ncbi:MAG: sugar phosphate isomerase/epimerase family protein [Bryobacteraceae bacterium]
MKRRHFLSAPMASLALPALAPAQAPAGKPFRISLAQWSLHRAIGSRLITNLDFPRIAREQFGIEGLEFVNTLWMSPTASYIETLRRNMRDTGTQCVLIMCDGEGFMGHPERAERAKAVANHHKWVDITAELGGHSIRTNMYPGPTQPKTPAEIDDFLNRCAESYKSLGEYAKARNINVIIENHGGISSDADVVVGLMKKVNLPNVGTLPDFGNFPKEADKYEAVRKMMPYAKGVSFKCLDFSPDGNETTIDVDRMIKIVVEARYSNWIGIEYEGRRLTEFEGIQAGKRFLERYF